MQIDKDIKQMLTGADDLEEATRMLYMEQTLECLGQKNRIYKWLVAIMRKEGFESAYDVLQDYTANGCGMSG